jgi:ATP-dependent DNA ligase
MTELIDIPYPSRPLKKRQQRFVIHREAVVLSVDGTSDFNALHSGEHNDEVQLYAFDILALDGDDMRPLSLSMSKAHLSRSLARRPAFPERRRAGRDRARVVSQSWKDWCQSIADRPYRGGSRSKTGATTLLSR